MSKFRAVAGNALTYNWRYVNYKGEKCLQTYLGFYNQFCSPRTLYNNTCHMWKIPVE